MTASASAAVEILEGFRKRTAGHVSVLGEDPASAGAGWRARIGVVLQESQPEPELSVRECLSLYAGFYPRSGPVDEVLEPTTAGAASASPSSASVRTGRTALGLIRHQTSYELRMFWRNKQSRFFTIALPILFLLIFATIWRNDTVEVAGGEIDESVYYVPGIMTLGILSAAFNNLVISITAARESGICLDLIADPSRHAPLPR